MPDHSRYLLQLYQQGQLRSAGPFSDGTGAALVVDAIDAPQARALVEADPAVIQAVFAYKIHPWAPVSWEGYGQYPETHP